jgi:hypothetical protein
MGRLPRRTLQPAVSHHGTGVKVALGIRPFSSSYSLVYSQVFVYVNDRQETPFSVEYCTSTMS